MAFERRVILILLLLVGVSLFERQGFDLAKRTRARADEVPPNFHFSSRAARFCLSSQLRVVLYGNFHPAHTEAPVVSERDTVPLDSSDHPVTA